MRRQPFNEPGLRRETDLTRGANPFCLVGKTNSFSLARLRPVHGHSPFLGSLMNSGYCGWIIALAGTATDAAVSPLSQQFLVLVAVCAVRPDSISTTASDFNDVPFTITSMAHAILNKRGQHRRGITHTKHYLPSTPHHDPNSPQLLKIPPQVERIFCEQNRLLEYSQPPLCLCDFRGGRGLFAP